MNEALEDKALFNAAYSELDWRKAKIIRDSLGEKILGLLDAEDVTEVYINEDNIVRVERHSGRTATDIVLTDEDVNQICKAISGVNDQIIKQKNPILGVEIALLRVRAQLMYPPVTPKPTFFLRKLSSSIYSLEEFLEIGLITQTDYNAIVEAIKAKKNIIVAGATGSGKTTFLNGLLKKLSEIYPNDRVLLLEDVPELQCSSKDVQRLQTSGNRSVDIKMQDLVFSSMRLSPQFIIIGEVRDLSAYDVLKSWNTGHPGYCTLHADNCLDALTRMELLIKESRANNETRDIKSLIGNTVDMIISIQKRVIDQKTKHTVNEIILLNEYDSTDDRYLYTKI